MYFGYDQNRGTCEAPVTREGREPSEALQFLDAMRFGTLRCHIWLAPIAGPYCHARRRWPITNLCDLLLATIEVASAPWPGRLSILRQWRAQLALGMVLHRWSNFANF